MYTCIGRHVYIYIENGTNKCIFLEPNFFFQSNHFSHALSLFQKLIRAIVARIEMECLSLVHGKIFLKLCKLF